MPGTEHYGLTRRRMLGLLGTGAGLAMFGAGDLFAVEPRITVPSYNDLSDEEEVSLGRKFAEQLEKKIEIVDQPIISDYLNGIVQNLAKVSQRKNIPYYVKFVNTYDINAFSIPGGGIYVFRGLVKICDQESELVATLSHEIGHIVGHHAANEDCLNVRAKQLYDQLKANVLKNNEVVAEIIEKLGGPLAILAMLRYQRQQEYEADMLGFYEMLRGDYEPKGFLKLFAKFAAMEAKGKQVPGFLRDHPYSDDRALRIRKELTQVKLHSSPQEDSFKFQAFKVAMNVLPEPAKSAGRTTNQQGNNNDRTGKKQ
jgi:predicted Zn-dependent protease